MLCTFQECEGLSNLKSPVGVLPFIGEEGIGISPSEGRRGLGHINMRRGSKLIYCMYPPSTPTCMIRL